MEAQWNGRKDVAATDMTDFERDEAKCSIDFCRLRGGLIWSLQVGKIEESFTYQFRPFKICFDQLPAISPELVNELRILRPASQIAVRAPSNQAGRARSTLGRVFHFHCSQVRTGKPQVHSVLVLCRMWACWSSFLIEWNADYGRRRTLEKACGTRQAVLRSPRGQVTVRIHLPVQEFRRQPCQRRRARICGRARSV